LGTKPCRYIIARIKLQKPDAVFVSFQAPSGQAKFLKQSKELGLGATILSPSDIEDPSLLKSYGPFMDGVLYARPTVSGDAEKFNIAFREFTGRDVTGPSAANAYDAARVLLAAIEQHITTGTELRGAVEHISIPGTVVQQIRFDDTHQIYGSMYEMKTVRNGEFVVVDK
jgi:ABC-type branched-subunit amino acid transport system substrate-binding protein